MLSFQNGLKVVLCIAIVGNVALAAERPTLDSVKSATGIIDLSLTSNGELVGRYLDGEGRGIDGASVALSKNGQVMAQSSTDRKGTYRLSAVTGGVYHLTVGNETHIVRVWTSSLAPSAARPMLTTVRGDQVLRGQSGGPWDLGVVLGIAGIAVGTVALVEAEEAKDDAAKAREDMATLSGTGSPVSP